MPAKPLLLLLLLLTLPSAPGCAAEPDTLATEAGKKPSEVHPWRMLGDVLITNGSFLLMDRFVLNEPFSKVTFRSMRRNLRSSFVWDNDAQFMNQFGHPYQGSIFYNSARSNGFSVLGSASAVALGSLLWEYACETDPPSVNDMVTTVASGTLFGELTHQMSQHIIDNRRRGAGRVIREAANAVLCPADAFERLVSGRMWKLGANAEADSKEPVSLLRVAVADRYAVAMKPASHGRHLPAVAIVMEQGGADGEAHRKPYDFFALDGMLTLGSSAFFARLALEARLCSTPLTASEDISGELGLYQFYRYEDTRLADSLRGPFPFGETAAFGPGVMFSMPRLLPRMAFEQRLFVHGVALGSAESDYYMVKDRHYNMGSGYGASAMSRLTWQGRASLQADAYYLHLFTWKNAMGDSGNARLLSLGLQLRARLTPHVGLMLGATSFSRHSHYTHHENKAARSYELRAGLEWAL